MKKVQWSLFVRGLSLILSLAILLSLAACGSKEPGPAEIILPKLEDAYNRHDLYAIADLYEPEGKEAANGVLDLLGLGALSKILPFFSQMIGAFGMLDDMGTVKLTENSTTMESKIKATIYYHVHITGSSKGDMDFDTTMTVIKKNDEWYIREDISLDLNTISQPTASSENTSSSQEVDKYSEYADVDIIEKGKELGFQVVEEQGQVSRVRFFTEKENENYVSGNSWIQGQLQSPFIYSGCLEIVAYTDDYAGIMMNPISLTPTTLIGNMGSPMHYMMNDYMAALPDALITKDMVTRYAYMPYDDKQTDAVSKTGKIIFTNAHKKQIIDMLRAFSDNTLFKYVIDRYAKNSTLTNNLSATDILQKFISVTGCTDIYEMYIQFSDGSLLSSQRGRIIIIGNDSSFLTIPFYINTESTLPKKSDYVESKGLELFSNNNISSSAIYDVEENKFYFKNPSGNATEYYTTNGNHIGEWFNNKISN